MGKIIDKSLKPKNYLTILALVKRNIVPNHRRKVEVVLAKDTGGTLEVSAFGHIRI